jgi:hypothetical protein
VEDDISRTILGKQHHASLTLAWPFLQSTTNDALTDAGSTSRIFDAATQSPNAATKFSDAALSAARTSAYYATPVASFDVPAATSSSSSAYAKCFNPRKPEYK